MMTNNNRVGKRIPRSTKDVLADLKAAGRDVEHIFNGMVKDACDAYFDPGEQILMQGAANEAAYREFMQNTETNILELLVIGTDVQVYTSIEGIPAKEQKG